MRRGEGWWWLLALVYVLAAALGPALVVAGVLGAPTAALILGIVFTVTVTPLLVGLLLTLRADRRRAALLAAVGVPASAEILAVAASSYDGETRHTLTLRITGVGFEPFTSSLTTGALRGLGLGDRFTVIADPVSRAIASL